MPPLVLTVFAVTGLLALASLLPPLAPRLHLPLTVLLAGAGCGMGLLLSLVPADLPGGPIGDFLTALKEMTLSSEALLSIFLPALLFEAALATDLRRLMDDLGPILLLAVVAVLVTTLVVGLAMAAATGESTVLCLLLGAIIATTDPVAVVGVFRDLGAPKRLATLVEGESLFNDAAAIALFGLLLGILSGHRAGGFGATALSFLIAFCGGLGCGFVAARLAVALLHILRGHRRAEITLTVALAYLTFIAADRYLHVSGVVAVVTAALVLGTSGRIRLSPSAWEVLVETWGQLGFWANALIVLLAGLVVPRLIHDVGLGDIAALMVLIVAALAGRAVVLFAMLPALSALKIGQSVTHAQKLVILWGGLRGAVSLALALAVTEVAWLDAESRRFVALLSTAFVLFTLFVNGPSLRTLIRLLGLDRLTATERAVRDRVLGLALAHVEARIGELARELDLPAAAAQAVSRPYHERLQALGGEGRAMLDCAVRVQLGLLTLARREERIYLEYRRDRLIGSRMAPSLVAEAGRLQDAVKASGEEGYRAAARCTVGFSRSFRWALWANRSLAVERPLTALIAARFERLNILRLASRNLLDFTARQLAPVLGEDAARLLLTLIEERLALTTEALAALKLQYPHHAEALESRMLGRTALRLEEGEYGELLAEDVIGEEVHRDLNRQLAQRWRRVDRPPSLDLLMPVGEQIARVPLFAGLGAAARRQVARLLRPMLAVPGERIIAKGDQGEEMYFIASGAVEVRLDHENLHLGSGDFFGELALITSQRRNADVISLGYCRLLVLRARDFRKLLHADASFAAEIEAVARRRLGHASAAGS